MTRRVHYEAAFEDLLRSRGVPYVAVDETRRAIFAGARIKSFDFLVYAPAGRPWIIDVKGRRFPYTTSRGNRCYWENWVCRPDLDGLNEWQGVFGGDFEARFVFAYLLDGPADRWPAVRPHLFRGQHYAFFSVALTDYQRHCHRRSSRWDTLSVPRPIFRRIIQPI